MCNIRPATSGQPDHVTASRRLLAVVAVAAGVALVLSACSSTSNSATNGPTGTTSGSTPSIGFAGGSTDSGVGPSGKPTTWAQKTAADGRSFLTDAQGRALQLRGFNIKTRDPLADASDDLLAAGQQRGFNLLRLSIYWDQFEPAQGQYDQTYLDAVQTVLDRAAAHGIYVVLDFHQDVFGAKFGDHGVPLWATHDDGLAFTKHDVWLLNYLEPAVQAAWDHLYEDPDLRQAQADAWTTVAKRFQGAPALIGYDLLNEPFGKVTGTESIADAATRVQKNQLTPMYQRLTDAIHAVDPDHWVLFEPPNVASLGVPVALGQINGTKLIYYPHFYDAAIETATYAAGGQVDGFDPAFFVGYEKAIKDYPAQFRYPTLFGEWGIAHPERPGMDAFVAQSLALMDRLGSGWTVFNWCRGDGYCPLDAAGHDRPAIGQIVQPYASAIAGSPISFGFDPVSRVLRVSFTDDDATGTTDIAIPPSTYPEGWKASAADAEGSWSSTFDSATNIVHIATPRTRGDHVVCVAPATYPTGCPQP